MAREPEKVNSACLRTNRVEIVRRLHLASSILLLDRERQSKYSVDKHDESCTKSRDDLASGYIFSAFSQFLSQLGRPTSGRQLAWKTQITPVSWSFTDRNSVLTQSNSYAYIYVSTDAAGN
jgi:hypothetical protein